MGLHVWVHFAWFGLMLAQLGFASWLGTRLGAFAVMRILVPLGFFGYYAEWLLSRGALGHRVTVDEVRAETTASLLSFLTVFSFALPYFALLTWVAPRLGRAAGVVVSVLGATASAVALRFAYGALTHSIAELPHGDRHVIACVVALALMVIAHLLLRARGADRTAPAECSLRNALARSLTLTIILLVLDDAALRQSPIGWILSAIPRLTPELVAGTHAANGPRSAQAVLAGLPLGLTPYFVFCAAFPYLAGWTDSWNAYGVAVVLSLVSIAPLLVDVLKRRNG